MSASGYAFSLGVGGQRLVLEPWLHDMILRGILGFGLLGYLGWWQVYERRKRKKRS